MKFSREFMIRPVKFSLPNVVVLPARVSPKKITNWTFQSKLAKNPKTPEISKAETLLNLLDKFYEMIWKRFKT